MGDETTSRFVVWPTTATSDATASTATQSPTGLPRKRKSKRGEYQLIEAAVVEIGLVASRMLTVALQLRQVFGFLAVFAAVLTERTFVGHDALA